MRILLIEDDSATAQSVYLMLRAEGFNITACEDGEEGISLAKLYDFDAIVLDMTLPDMTGADVLRSVRTAKISTPVVVLSGTGGIEETVRCLGLGADDYMTKPFHKDELIARIYTVIRRARGHSQTVIRVGDLAVDINAKSVTVRGQPVYLTIKEYQMLELLAVRKNTTLSKDMFLNHLYGGRDEPEPKIIDVFVCKLRKKLADASGGDIFVQTVWGRGYILPDPEPEPVPA